MTREELQSKAEEMIPAAIDTLKREIVSLIESGGLPIDDEPAGSFALAKCVLAVALERVAKNHTPYDWDTHHWKIVKNLRVI